MNELTETNPISREEERKLVRRYRKGDLAARDLLILANMRFIVATAKKYQKPSIDLNDLIQGGVLGLVDAINKFDPDRPTRLLTMAYWWIRRGMLQILEGQRPRGRLRMSTDSSSTDEVWEYEDYSAAAEVEDPGPPPDEVADVRIQAAEIRAHMRELSLRHRTIIEMRCGLWNGPALNNTEIGKRLGISSERVRQLYNEAIKAIRTKMNV